MTCFLVWFSSCDTLLLVCSETISSTQNSETDSSSDEITFYVLYLSPPKLILVILLGQCCREGFVTHIPRNATKKRKNEKLTVLGGNQRPPYFGNIAISYHYQLLIENRKRYSTSDGSFLSFPSSLELADRTPWWPSSRCGNVLRVERPCLLAYSMRR